MSVEVERGRVGCQIGGVVVDYTGSEEVDAFDELIVNVGGIITRGPSCLSISRGGPSRIMLLFSRVYDGNAIVEHGKGDGVLV